MIWEGSWPSLESGREKADFCAVESMLARSKALCSGGGLDAVGLATNGCSRTGTGSSGIMRGGETAVEDGALPPDGLRVDFSAESDRPSSGVVRSVIVDRGRRSSSGGEVALITSESKLNGGSCRESEPFPVGGCDCGGDCEGSWFLLPMRSTSGRGGNVGGPLGTGGGPAGPAPVIRSRRIRCSCERMADVRSSRGSRVSANSRSRKSNCAKHP